MADAEELFKRIFGNISNSTTCTGRELVHKFRVCSIFLAVYIYTAFRRIDNECYCLVDFL